MGPCRAQSKGQRAAEGKGPTEGRGQRAEGGRMGKGQQAKLGQRAAGSRTGVQWAGGHTHIPADEQACEQLGRWACQHVGVPYASAVFTAISPLVGMLPLGGGPHVLVPVCACGALRMPAPWPLYSRKSRTGTWLGSGVGVAVAAPEPREGRLCGGI